jgi:hypothetical protein
MKILEWTQRFLAGGIAIIPLYHRSKEPILSTWREFQSRLPSDHEVLSWFPTDWCNYAVIAGWSNLVVIDFDNIEYFNIWQLWCRDLWVNIAEVAFKVRTRKGMHVYVTTETPCANDKRISKSGGIDIQAQGKYVVGPGCKHPSGHVYAPIGDFFFPLVSDIETILPLDLFPRVRADDVVFNGTAPEFKSNHTEYECDPFAQASNTGMDLISKVKASVRIENLFSGVERSSVDGRWLKALCPFHKDNHPSAWIDIRLQIAGCNVCGMKPMDVLNVYARMHNISESVAVTELAREIGVWA